MPPARPSTKSGPRGRSRRTPIITLLTDFGLKDGNVGAMKGVILGIAPQARLVDLSHLAGPQDVRQGAWILGRAGPYFPEGTIHLAVVDPGVGTERRPIAARLGGQLFVGPDNGLMTRLLETAESERRPTAFVRLDRPELWLPQVSDVFHGRDIFAPVAAYLANGAPLESVGSPLADPVRLNLPRPVTVAGGLRGVVEHIDHFGNVRTNIQRADCGRQAPLAVRIGATQVNAFVRTFGERPAGELIALFGSSGDLVLAVVNGNAAQRLGAKVGDEVEVRLGQRDPG